MNENELNIILDVVGKHAGTATQYKQAFYSMCNYFLSHMEGDDLYTEEAYKLMREHGIVDENGFPTGKDYDGE